MVSQTQSVMLIAPVLFVVVCRGHRKHASELFALTSGLYRPRLQLIRLPAVHPVTSWIEATQPELHEFRSLGRGITGVV